jgi:3-dehydroquinate synthase
MTEVMAGSSPVVTGTDALARLEAWCAEASPEEGRFVLGDERTLTHCLPELLAQVPALRDAETLQLRSGERSKDLEVCRALWTRLAERAADRQAVLVNLGGGVVSDVGGFTAANYKRGIRFVNVPTTVMGMVDAAIGGKTAIDVERGEEPGGGLRGPRSGVRAPAVPAHLGQA